MFIQCIITGDKYLSQKHTRPGGQMTKSAKSRNKLGQSYVNSAEYIKSMIYFISLYTLA
jgi:hypothetical protein